MLIVGNSQYVEQPFDSEDELEQVVLNQFEYIFGPDAISLPKKLIKSPMGAGTIPDGFAIDIAEKRWFVVEAELASHGVWAHIAPQIAKQIIAATQPETHQMLSALIVNLVKSNPEVREKFNAQGIPEIDIRKFVGDILQTAPIIGLPIDFVNEDLKQWAQTIKNEVKLWTIRKLVDTQNSLSIIYEIPDEYRPTLDTTKDASTSTGISIYDVSISDLLKAQYLKAGDELNMTYSPRGGEKKSYQALIQNDGSLIVLGKKFSSPSYAAVCGIQDAGSTRSTVNGWTSWLTKNGLTLAELRKRYLSEKAKS